MEGKITFKGLDIEYEYPYFISSSGRTITSIQPKVTIEIPEIQIEVAIITHVVYNFDVAMEYMRDVFPHLFIKVPEFDSGIDDFNPLAYLNMKEPIRHELFRNIIESAMIQDILEAIQEHENQNIPEAARY
ncbi:MAG: hypothetical protein WC121_06455 [Candidatus Kapaibacterium sp.]